MKKSKILIVITLLIVFSTNVYAKDTIFSDIKDHWAEKEIMDLVNQDIISGYPDGTFKPDANISRSEFSTLMYRILGLKEEVSKEKTVVFKEIEGLWSEKFIEALVEKEVIIPHEYVNGYLANEEITRAEIAKMIIRAMDKDKKARKMAANTKFDDDENIKKEDKGYIYLAEYYGIISGYPDNTFRPNGLATRAEAVKMLIHQQKVMNKEIDIENKTHRRKHYPASKVQFSLPQYTHTDKEVEIESATENVKELIWKLEKQNEDDEMVEVELEAPLSTTGGAINFSDKGIYKLTAQATNYGNREFEFSKLIKVYPIPKVTFDLGAYAHTDSKIEVITNAEELSELDIVWSLEKEGQGTASVEDLSNDGGVITLKEKGNYTLKALITDEAGRVFEYEDSIKIYPIIKASFDLPETGHTDSKIDVTTALNEIGSNNIVWTLQKDGETVDISTYIEGSLDNKGGSIRFKDKGKYSLKATAIDRTGRAFAFQDTIEIYPIPKINISLPDSLHIGSEFNLITSPTDLGALNVAWSLSKDGQTVDMSKYLTGDITNNGGAISFNQVGDYTLTGTITDSTNRVFTYSDSVSVTNNPPSIANITADVTREILNGKFKVNLNVDSTDPDGDTVIYEYVGKTKDNYYPAGSHTVKVRAKDSYGLYSQWAIVNFDVENNPPTTPVITRTPNGNSVPPNTNVTITASSNDSDGDDITYVWEGRVAETGKYPLGKNVVKVKAVDEAGAESPQSAIVFFVADSQNGGGMTLTGPDSTIIEQGIEGGSIVEYTFTVPPVSGHNGSDHGRIKGYNPITDSWEQIDIEYTNNGITMTGSLEKGKYTKLEFYYYTNHRCMYNKSNITYSVEYYFE